MLHVDRTKLTASAAVVVAMVLSEGGLRAQDNPYRLVEGWARLPVSMNTGQWGQVTGVDTDSEGNVYVLHKCFVNTCVGRTEPPILKFDPAGELVASWGTGLIPWPHGFHVDRDGFVWTTDAAIPSGAPGEPGKGHQVIKFSPDGKPLLRLGTAGVAGEGPNTFNGPADVAVASTGDIFVADGHVNNRVVKFSKDGQFIKAWGRQGAAPGEFNLPHTIAIDSQGRVFVGDRSNNRIQIFDQEGNFLDQWTQFGRPSGIFIAADDTIYVADADSNAERNPGFKRGIWIGSARDGSIRGFIEDHMPDPGSGAEGVTADPAGNLYVAVVREQSLRKYLRE